MELFGVLPPHLAATFQCPMKTEKKNGVFGDTFGKIRNQTKSREEAMRE